MKPSAAINTHESSVARASEPARVDHVEHDVEVSAGAIGIDRDRALQGDRRAVAVGDPGEHLGILRTSWPTSTVPSSGPGTKAYAADFERDHLVEQVAATATVLLVDADAGQARLDDGLPALGEPGGGIALGFSHRGWPAQADGPGP